MHADRVDTGLPPGGRRARPCLFANSAGMPESKVSARRLRGGFFYCEASTGSSSLHPSELRRLQPRNERPVWMRL